jgi:hypothetical protein
MQTNIYIARKTSINVYIHLSDYWSGRKLKKIELSCTIKFSVFQTVAQQSLLTSHVSAPSVVSREESKWTYAGRSIEWIFRQFQTFHTGKVCKGFRACACFCSLAVITCPLRSQGPQFDPGQKHAFGGFFTENEKCKIRQRTEFILHQASFCSVV